MVSIRVGVKVKGLELLLLLVRPRVMVSIRVKGLELLLLLEPRRCRLELPILAREPLTQQVLYRV